MGLEYINLDEQTRSFMVQELNINDLYQSPRLTQHGLAIWPELIEEAARNHSDTWLENQLISQNCIKTSEYYIRAGVRRLRKVPKNSAQMLAEGEFNRYYLRGLCLRAQSEGIETLTVYRGKNVFSPRVESEAKIGTEIRVDTLLIELRSNDFVSVDSAFSVPSGPNSGLTAKLSISKTGIQPLSA